MPAYRPTIPALGLTLATAIYLLAITNRTFWSKALAYFDGHGLQLAGLALVLLLLHIAVLAIFSGKRLQKPVAIACILIAAASSYFVDRFGVILDRRMFVNIVETTQTEAGQLLTPALVLHMLLYGVLPAAVVMWIRIAPRPRGAAFRQAAFTSISAFLVALAIVSSQASFYIPMWRLERTAMMSTLVPATPVVGAISYGVREYRLRNIVMKPLGTDARTGPSIAKADRKVLTVLVVGETARAQNFSLLGYARDTNPELAARDVIAFSNVSSCGTATAVSLPCMFSHFGRAGYSDLKSLGSENLVDVLAHAGLHVEWWDNNSGSKKTAARIKEVDFYKVKDDRFCQPEGGDCNDDILIDRLKTHLDDFTGNGVLVLHTGGSHGPAYYLRYPADFARFKPDCQTAQISDCSSEELVNAYDNSILFTDHMLAEVIDLLKSRQDKFASAMIYVSDHGESLGEDGIYLHGAPYALAPSQQTHIPMIAWFSQDFARINRLNTACIAGKSGAELSHDNLFSSVLGMVDVSTSAYQPSLDAFAPCRTPDS
ncbi:MAG: phosphoethanolamine--lipid A transferase [Mesorhizobium sp.]